MADTNALPGAAEINPIAGGTGGDSNSQLMNVLTALLHANPPATSIDQASADTKAVADKNAASVEKPKAEDKKPAEPAPAAKQAAPEIPNTLTDSILNMNQIMPVSEAAKSGGDSSGGMNNLLDLLGGDAGKSGAGKGDASKLASTLHTVAKLATLFI